ncbi:MAG: hypothetical protein AUK34_10175 [Ignavibacteria bacterium CG2_30_36_16]|nr:MAG: hypothetical protein AUK34_10175 [Ignavibacteria bacterium CG2_30_36_16]PJB01790.1 MAG: hypothetical protein CO127_02005 [Ignavibacteria bacterium CG_4_9_14_3_um_filter_36_18]
MFVEKMEINKAKPHRGELFVEMKQPMKLSSVGATCSIAMHPACGIVFYVKIFMCLQFYILHSALYIFNCGLPR